MAKSNKTASKADKSPAKKTAAKASKTTKIVAGSEATSEG
jgi:hypothetical protein